MIVLMINDSEIDEYGNLKILLIMTVMTILMKTN